MTQAQVSTESLGSGMFDLCHVGFLEDRGDARFSAALPRATARGRMIEAQGMPGAARSNTPRAAEA
ncbi:MAG: hypothetical protein Q4615_00260 [Paracoccus aminovorans]|nr:hypothetical protein [Paracoccus aminovorans]